MKAIKFVCMDKGLAVSVTFDSILVEGKREEEEMEDII